MRNVVGLCILAAGTCCGRAEAQRIHQQDFEDRVTHFKVLLAQANAESALVDHALVRSNPHGGLQAERMVVRNSGGDTCLVGYEFPKSLVVDELNLSVWVNANRPGVALLARVVLPHDSDPETGKATVILLEGDVGTLAGRWKNLTLTRPLAALKRKQNLLQGRRGASVDLREAYCDMLLLNVHTGIGESAVLIDDLQVGPLVDVKGAAGDVAASEVPTNMKGDKVVQPTVRSAEDKRRVEIRDGVLYRGDRAFFVRGVRRSSAEGAGPPAPIVRLAEAQFNTVFAAAPIDQTTADEAEKHGVAIVPQLGLIEGGTKPRPLNRIEDLDFRDRQRWIGWHLGSNLDAYSAGAVRETVRSLRARDPQSTRPTFGTALQGWRPLSSELDVLVVQRHPLMTSLGLEDYGRWLQQRRDYAEPRKVMLNTLQTHPPLDVAQLTFGHGPDEAYGSSIGPTPAQMRLLAYASLQAGYRGLVYSADWALSDPAQGRDRMLQAALLNLEMTMFEPFFAEGKAPEPCRCSNKDFAAVVFPHQRALLVMVYSIAPDSQYVVGQASGRDVDVVVSGAPDGAQAHAVSLGGMEGVIPQSSLGGRRIRVRDVDTAAFVLVTTDTQLLVNFQDALPE
ncbi:MAG TPA: hypothetical protein VNC50_19645, partial [Planctomycetia bacterium]|nr:hypothetical protein [Planctomycetia bacterium]